MTTQRAGGLPADWQARYRHDPASDSRGHRRIVRALWLRETLVTDFSGHAHPASERSRGRTPDLAFHGARPRPIPPARAQDACIRIHERQREATRQQGRAQGSYVLTASKKDASPVASRASSTALALSVHPIAHGTWRQGAPVRNSAGRVVDSSGGASGSAHPRVLEGFEEHPDTRLLHTRASVLRDGLVANAARSAVVHWCTQGYWSAQNSSNI